jgi:hypothetical protein
MAPSPNELFPNINNLSSSGFQTTTPAYYYSGFPIRPCWLSSFLDRPLVHALDNTKYHLASSQHKNYH